MAYGTYVRCRAPSRGEALARHSIATEKVHCHAPVWRSSLPVPTVKPIRQPVNFHPPPRFTASTARPPCSHPWRPSPPFPSLPARSGAEWSGVERSLARHWPRVRGTGRLLQWLSTHTHPSTTAAPLSARPRCAGQYRPRTRPRVRASAPTHRAPRRHAPRPAPRASRIRVRLPARWKAARHRRRLRCASPRRAAPSHPSVTVSARRRRRCRSQRADKTHLHSRSHA